MDNTDNNPWIDFTELRLREEMRNISQRQFENLLMFGRSEYRVDGRGIWDMTRVSNEVPMVNLSEIEPIQVNANGHEFGYNIPEQWLDDDNYSSSRDPFRSVLIDSLEVNLTNIHFPF